MTAAEIIAVRRAMLASFERTTRDLAILTPATELDDLLTELMTIVNKIRVEAEPQAGGDRG